MNLHNKKDVKEGAAADSSAGVEVGQKQGNAMSYLSSRLLQDVEPIRTAQVLLERFRDLIGLEVFWIALGFIGATLTLVLIYDQT